MTQKSDEREGIVLAVSPEAGTKAKANEPVTVTVAAAYTVPDITGMTWDQAVAAIEAEGLTATSAYVYDDAAADGTILGTSPAAGEKVASGSSVTVNIARSRGAELTAAAQAYLASAGTVNIGGTTYAIQSVDGITYQGNDTTAFTITAAAITTLDGETVRGLVQAEERRYRLGQREQHREHFVGAAWLSQPYDARGIVLRKTKLGESDLILTMLVEDGSQVRAVAKGGAQACELFRFALGALFGGRRAFSAGAQP
ncbi:recombination protein O N-terminal domain-containing protein [Paraeggerthella sp.]|uniref:PASTA domain-containing protein n=1 Tax=Paraeggerthella sp. TaxID=2897350 RepID=UPI00352949DF